MSELLPCPFCGGEAVAFGGSMEAIHCSNRDCALEHYSMPANKWNRRPQPVSGVPSVEDIRNAWYSPYPFDSVVGNERFEAIHALLQQSAVQPVSREADCPYCNQPWSNRGMVDMGPQIGIRPCDHIGHRQFYGGAKSGEQVVKEWLADLDSHPEIEFDDMKALADRIDQSVLTPPADGGWVAVTERLPEHEHRGQEWIVCWKGAKRAVSTKQWPELWHTAANPVKKGFEITHWHPLPPPPAKGKGE